MDLLNVADVHNVTIARRRGAWEVVEAFGPAAEPGVLTSREIEVLTWVARGKSAWEIGEILQISKRTVDEHDKKATRKLGAVNRTQAAAVAVRERIIDRSGRLAILNRISGHDGVVDSFHPLRQHLCFSGSDGPEPGIGKFK
jgi:DNA-binding CsgD family transcriptional regulator